MLARRLRHQHNINTTLGQRLAFSGILMTRFSQNSFFLLRRVSAGTDFSRQNLTSVDADSDD